MTEDKWTPLERLAKAVRVVGLSFEEAAHRRQDLNSETAPAAILELIAAARRADGAEQ
jgi:hypothetical protein